MLLEWLAGAGRSCYRGRMLDTGKIAELAAAAARKWIAVERVLVEPTVDSQGEDALRVTLVLDPEVIEGMSGDHALDVLVEIRQSLQAAGDERFPLILYRTEPELVAEAQF